MSMQFDSFIEAAGKAIAPEKTVLSPEILAAAKQIGEKVEKWGCEHNLMVEKKFPRGGKLFAATENFHPDQIEQALGAQAIADLVADCGIPKCHEVAACKKVAAVLCQVLGKDGSIAFADYNSNDTETKGELVSLESLYGAELWDAVAPAQEAFGINMDRVTPDLRTIISVALLQFQVALTPRIMPIQAVTQSNVQITRDMMDVFDMSKPDDPPTRVIDLYRDPTMVSTKCTRIEPLKAKNDPTGKYLVADGIYKWEEEFNLFKLALDPDRPGFDRFNHTDTVEDGIIMDGVLVELSKGEGDQAVTEQFMLPLNKDKARLTQVPNDHRSTIRRMTLDRFTLALNASTAVYGSTEASKLLTDFTVASGKYLAIRPHIEAQVDRKTANASAQAFGKLSVRSTDPTYVATEEDKTLAASYKLTFVGFTLDARYNEDNKRKTSIRLEINRRNMSFELPAGRNFVIDFAIGQEGATNAAARLAQVEHIGRDGNNVRIITETLQNVHDQRLQLGNGAAANAEIASTYAAGDMVHQTAYLDSLDFGTGFLAIRSADATGDIKQFVKVRLNKIVTGLLTTSLLQQQLAPGSQVTFRMLTSPFILGAILSCHHIHAHLDNLDAKGQGDVEFVLNLDCGAKLEVVTCTFDSMVNRIVLVPMFESAPASVLNFSTNYDQGTLVGAITLGADSSSAHNRIFSTTRECTIPTNVVGAVIEVVGLGDPRVSMDYPGIVEASSEDNG